MTASLHLATTLQPSALAEFRRVGEELRQAQLAVNLIQQKLNSMVLVAGLEMNVEYRFEDDGSVFEVRRLAPILDFYTGNQPIIDDNEDAPAVADDDEGNAPVAN